MKNILLISPVSDNEGQVSGCTVDYRYVKSTINNVVPESL